MCVVTGVVRGVSWENRLLGGALMIKPLIFLVESDPQSCRVIRAYLERANYRVREYFSHEIFRDVEELQPSVVLIDATLRNGKSLELCSKIRRSPLVRDTKVILVSDRGLPSEYALGFEAGVDDYLIRPVLPRDLLDRIEAVLRRTPFPAMLPEVPEDTELKLGDLELNLLAMRVSVAGTVIPTTVLEFRLLEYMARNEGRVFTRDQLLDAVWGEECFVTPRTVDACVRRIRNKIESGRGRPSLLKTVRGIGYCLENAFSPASLACEDANRRRVS